MSSDQVKTEINQILRTLPEENLLSLLKYFRAAQNISAQKVNMAKNFSLILNEDRNLLKRLSQLFEKTPKDGQYFKHVSEQELWNNRNQAYEYLI